jgi:hypothetical protein
LRPQSQTLTPLPKRGRQAAGAAHCTFPKVGRNADFSLPSSPIRNFLLSAVFSSQAATAEAFMGTGHAGKGMGNQSTTGNQGVGANDPGLPDESDMTQQVQGNNQLAGNDQVRAHNERRGVPGETTRTQGVVESFEMLDPAKRAAHMNENKKSG